MPTYSYICENCNPKEIKNISCEYKNRDNIYCDKCNLKMSRQINISKNIQYGDKITEKRIGISKIYRELEETKKREQEFINKEIKRGDYKL